MIDDLHRILPLAEGKKGRDSVAEAIAWLEGEEAWDAFVGAVEWRFEAPDLDAVRQQIADRLAGSTAASLPAAQLIDRLVARLIEASSRAATTERVLTSADLAGFLSRIGEELAAWAATPAAVRLRGVFDELGTLRRIVDHPTLTWSGDRGAGELGPGRLLSAVYQVIPFEEEGRRDDLDALAAWCGGDERASVLLVTGEGGMGKTRLLIEWCQRLEHQGWIAGFVRPGLLRREPMPGDLEPFFEGTIPRLAVIDYAETRSEAVFALLQRLAAVKDGPKVRLALAARQVGDWWDGLPRRDEAVAHLVAVRSPPPRRLAALVAEGEARQAAFRRAAAGFAAALGRPPPDGSPPAIAGADFDRALYLHMAALAAVCGQPIEGAGEALAWTLEHEQRFWEKQIDGLGLDGPDREALNEAMAPLVAAFTLAGGAADETDALDLLAAVAGDRLERRSLRRSVVRLLARLYAGAGGRLLAALEPDLLGEELVAECLDRDPGLVARFFDASRRRGGPPGADGIDPARWAA